MIPGDLDDHQGDAIGIPDPHFHQPPGLDAWGLDDLDARRLKLSVDHTQVAHLEPQLHRRAGRFFTMSRDLEEPPPKKKTTPRVRPLPHSR